MRLSLSWENMVSIRLRMPVFLVHPVRNFESDICNLKEILLNLGTEIAFVSKHYAVMVFPLYILEIMNVVNACCCHVIGVYDTSYSTDCMQFVAIIMQTLRGTVSPVWEQHRHSHVPWHNASPMCSGIPDRFGVNAEYILRTINSHSNILVDFFGKQSHLLTTGIELPRACGKTFAKASGYLFIVDTLKHTAECIFWEYPYGNNLFDYRRFKWRLPNWSISVLVIHLLSLPNITNMSISSSLCLKFPLLVLRYSGTKDRNFLKWVMMLSRRQSKCFFFSSIKKLHINEINSICYRKKTKTEDNINIIFYMNSAHKNKNEW